MVRTTANLLSSAVLLLGSVANAQTTISNVSTSACPAPGGAHIIVARASGEAPGYGIIGAVKDYVLKAVPGSTAEFVQYPATITGPPPYIESESDGVVAMRQLVNNFIAKCSACSPLVLLGYSQGAQVSADTLVGQQDQGFPDNSSINQPLPASTLSRVAALVLMGDPTFNTIETFHVGNATKNSLFPRKNVANFNIAGLASRTQSYCDFNDPYCASGNFSNGRPVHNGYVPEYGAKADAFILSQIKAYLASGTCGGTNGTGNGNNTTPCPPNNGTINGGGKTNGTTNGGGSTNGTTGGNGGKGGSGSGSGSSSGSPGSGSGNGSTSTGSGSGSGSGSSSSSGGSSSASSTIVPSTGAASTVRGLGKTEALTSALAFGLLAWLL